MSAVKQVAILLAMLCAPAMARADAVADFYRGKTVSIIIGAGEGGFYDQSGRLMAQYLRKYIPGNPAVIAQNMPGASQLRAVEHAYNIAPRDGTNLVVVQPYVILNKLLNRDLKFEIQRLTWVGRVGGVEMGGIVASQAPVRDFADARKTELIIGGNAANGPATMIPWALNRLAGARFRVILGYPSQTAEVLAMERGEIQGIGNGSLGELVAREKIRVLYASGRTRLAAYPDAPALPELVSEQDRPVMDILGSLVDVGLTLMGTPDIPADRLAALRSAFDQMMADPGYLEGLARQRFKPDPLTGAALSDYIGTRFSASDALIERLRAATAQP
jgi:tripartite-type tricarboxylate transporter receptor subunit TctC